MSVQVWYGCGSTGSTTEEGHTGDDPVSSSEGDTTVTVVQDEPADDQGGDGEPGPAGEGEQQVVTGDSCDGHGEDATAGGDFARDGNVWSREQFYGCGCPERPEWTMVVEEGTSPLRVRLCHDDAADPCEMGCRRVLSWDLSAHLGDATDIEPAVE